MRARSKCPRLRKLLGTGAGRIFRNFDIAHIEADDRPRAVGNRIVPMRAGKDAATTTASWKAAAFRPGAGWEPAIAGGWPVRYWRGRVTAFGAEMTLGLRCKKSRPLTWISAAATRGHKIFRWIGRCITRAVIEVSALRRSGLEHCYCHSPHSPPRWPSCPESSSPRQAKRSRRTTLSACATREASPLTVSPKGRSVVIGARDEEFEGRRPTRTSTEETVKGPGT